MVICKQCNKRMPNDKILDLHMVKRHGGKNAEVATVIKPEDKKVELPVAITPAETEEAKVFVEGMVEIESVDGRVLEVAVGSDSWKGTTITVHSSMVEEIRRLLEAGGFYLKG